MPVEYAGRVCLSIVLVECAAMANQQVSVYAKNSNGHKNNTFNQCHLQAHTFDDKAAL